MCRPNDYPDLTSEELNKQQLAMQSEKERGEGGRKHPFAMDVSLKSNPYLEDDEMVTWKHIEDALDRSYCSELFGELPRAHHLSKDSFLNDQASMMMMMRDGDDSRATSGAAMAMGVGRAAGLLPQAGADAFNRVRTSALHPRATASCSELAFPSPLKTTPSQHQHLRPSLSNLPSPASPKTSFHLPSINIDRTRQPFASPGKEVFDPCVPSKATSTTDIASSRQSDFFPHGRDQSQQDTGCSLPPTFPLKQDVNAAKEKVKHCHRDASSLSGSAITASEKGTASLQTVDVSPSWGSDVSTEKSAKEGSTSSCKKKTRPAEESEYQSEDVEEAAVDAKKPPSARSSLTKRARAAEIHNLSERKRRDKINLRMKALQELIPNANKTDKASVLDEAIEYLKMLQAQLQFMSMRTGMVVPPTIMPPGMQYLPMQQMLAFPHMDMGMGTGMGLAMGMGIGMAAADAAGAGAVAGAGPSVVSFPPLHGQSLSGPAYYPSEFQPSSSSSVIDEAQDDLQNFHLNERHNVFPAQQQQPMHLSMQTNADMYSTFIQLQQHTQENGGSKGIQ